MPHGPRIALLSALLATGCHTAERQPNALQPLKPIVNSQADPGRKPTTPTAGTGRAPAYQPVVNSENFQRPIAESTNPQPGVVPSSAVPSLPSTSFGSAPPQNSPAPLTPPGSSGAAVPPTSDVGEFKVPPLMGTR